MCTVKVIELFNKKDQLYVLGSLSLTFLKG